MNAIRQWLVRTPHGAAASVFEDAESAWLYAADCAEAAAPSVLTLPNGLRYYVLREDDMVEVSTRHKLVGTTRRIVEP